MALAGERSVGSQIYKSHRPANDTAVVSLLRLAGAVIMGKCVTTEFASPVPIGTRNPHDLRRSPGERKRGRGGGQPRSPSLNAPTAQGIGKRRSPRTVPVDHFIAPVRGPSRNFSLLLPCYYRGGRGCRTRIRLPFGLSH